MNWPSYRDRYLPAFTRHRLSELAADERAFVVLPTGAVEQHGPQLPVGVDALMGQALLDRALPKLPADAPVYVAPPVQAGKSNEHDGFPGNLIISRETLRRMILCAGRQIAAWGFGRLGILNTHGGNISVVKSALRELHHTVGLETRVLGFPYTKEISEREAVFGIHANEVESSLMYALTPAMVDPEAATCCWSGSPDDPRSLQSEFAPATYAWKTLDISPSGTVGDATAATREKGERWLERAADSLAATLAAEVGEG